MKMVTTTLGTRQIEDWDANLIPLQLREVLQELRSALIDKLVSGGLENYISLKFHQKPDVKGLWEIKSKLKSLRNSGIDINNYRSILEMVLQKDNSYIDTAFFYPEIDNTIRWHLQPNLFSSMSTYTLDNIDLVQSIRRGLIAKILTEQGLKDYVYGMYAAKLNDRAKVHYILDELRDYFFNEPTDYKAMLKTFAKDKVVDISEASQLMFDQEVEKILDKHFEVVVR
jgi:hypothetical protein